MSKKPARLEIETFAYQNADLVRAGHELAHYWLGENFDFMGIWIALATRQCQQNYPAIWAYLQENNVSGCCVSVELARNRDFADYCQILAGREAERLFFQKRGYCGTAYKRWRANRDAVEAGNPNSDLSRILDNPISRDPLAVRRAKSLIRAVLTQKRKHTRRMIRILLEQGALILNPRYCPRCRDAGYVINYRFAQV